jgi:hypothetical protein
MSNSRSRSGRPISIIGVAEFRFDSPAGTELLESLTPAKLEEIRARMLLAVDEVDVLPKTVRAELRERLESDESVVDIIRWLSGFNDDE